MIEVKFTFPDLNAASAFIESLRPKFEVSTGAVAQSGSAVEAAASNPQVAGSNPASTPPSSETPKRGRGRPPKVETPKATTEPAAPSSSQEVQAPSGGQPQESPAAAASPAPITNVAPYTDADVRTALQKIAAKHGAQGLAEVSKFIASFNVQRVSELKPEQYADVIAAVEKAVA